MKQQIRELNNDTKNAKYLHIIWHPDLKFIPKLIKMINEEDSYFNLEEHIFITPHKKVYDEMSKNMRYICVGMNRKI